MQTHDGVWFTGIEYWYNGEATEPLGWSTLFPVLL